MSATTSLQRVQSYEEALQQLIQRKTELETHLTIKQKVEKSLEKDWEPIRQSKVAEFDKKMERLQALIRMEISLLEILKNYVDVETCAQVREVFTKVRATNNLSNLISVYHKHTGEIKTRQILKLISAVYRYNRDIIDGYIPSPTVKSNIKIASECPHCGEIAAQILFEMMKTGTLSLPM